MTTLQLVHMFGVVRYDPALGKWVILDNATHRPCGLSSVEVVAATGELQINYTQPLTTVGTAHVTMDEAYAGKVFAGPSVGLAAIYLTFRINGTTVPCTDTRLKVNNSNVFISVWGDIEVSA